MEMAYKDCKVMQNPWFLSVGIERAKLECGGVELWVEAGSDCVGFLIRTYLKCFKCNGFTIEDRYEIT